MSKVRKAFLYHFNIDLDEIDRKDLRYDFQVTPGGREEVIVYITETRTRSYALSLDEIAKLND